LLPPSGIALAAILLFGYRIWPAIMAGAFLANLATVNETIATAGGIAVGNTLEAVLGGLLMGLWTLGYQNGKLVLVRYSLHCCQALHFSSFQLRTIASHHS